MADNLALKLLVAGIIGAVVGAAAAEKYHFPTGLVYGFNGPSPYGTRQSIDPGIGAGQVERYGEGRGEPRIVLVPDWPDVPPGGRYRPPRSPAPARTAAWCWQEYENWNFAMSGRWVRCRPHNRYRGG